MTSTKAPDTTTPQKSRGRTSTFDRVEALDIALDLFWRHGYEGVGIADLTKAIGIAAPSLYHAFGSKEDLYRTVLDRYGSGGMSVAEIEAAPSAYDAARALLGRAIDAVTTPGRPLGCMISSGMLMAGPDHAALAADLTERRAALRRALRDRIARDVADGRLPADADAGSIARFTVTVLQGISVQALDGADPAELRAVAALALRSWARGRFAVCGRCLRAGQPRRSAPA